MVKKNMFLFSFILITLGNANLIARQYVEPPSSTTSSSVPVISDEAMVACVRLYNETKWLNEEIGNMHVNQYSEESVDAYNAKVELHSSMTNKFNTDCARKQSKSAYEAAQKLNSEK